MTKHSILAAAATALILGLAACDAATTSNETGNAAVAQSDADGLSKLGAIRMDVDTSYLSAEEREVVNLLIQAAEPDERDLQAPDDARLRQASRRCGREERSEAARAIRRLLRPVGPDRRRQALLRRRGQAGRARASIPPT